MTSADSPRTALDTSVLVAGICSWHVRHADAQPFLAACLVADDPLIVPLPALIEAWAVLTRMPAPHRLSPQDAHALLDGTLRQRSAVVALEGSEGWSMLDDALRAGVAGGSSYDLHIAACARKGGATRLATFNERHFERFDLPGLEIVIPGAQGRAGGL